MPRPSHSSSFDQQHNIGWGVHIIKQLTIQPALLPVTLSLVGPNTFIFQWADLQVIWCFSIFLNLPRKFKFR
jgi:hypothetical protein